MGWQREQEEHQSNYAPQQAVWGWNSFLLWLNVLICGLNCLGEEVEARLKA